MTLTDLRADLTFDRHTIPNPPLASWVNVAATILETSTHELGKLTPSHRESLTIGLRSTDHPSARAALTLLAGIP